MPFIAWGEGPFSQLLSEAPAAVCPQCGGHAAEVPANVNNTATTIYRCNGCKYEFEKPLKEADESKEQKPKKCQGCGLVKSPLNSEGFCRQCVKDNGKEDGLVEPDQK